MILRYPPPRRYVTEYLVLLVLFLAYLLVTHLQKKQVSFFRNR